MQSRICGNEYRRTMVCIDSYENGVPAGRFYNPFFPEGKTFSSLTQFLIGMEDALNAMNFPQSFAVARSFSGAHGQRKALRPEGDAHTGILATFAIRLIFRQNASWQGSITWLEGEVEQSFRSVLELILLMDSALMEGKREAKKPICEAAAAAAH